MTRVLVASRSPGELRIGLLEGGIPVRLAVERDHARPLTGAIVAGRVTRREPGLDGAFVDLGHLGSGFLPDDGRTPVEGERALFQVVREARETKAPRLARRLAIEGWTVVVTRGRGGVSLSRHLRGVAGPDQLAGRLRARLPAGFGAILRTPSMVVSEAVVAAEIDRGLARLQSLEADGDGLVLAAPTALERMLAEEASVEGFSAIVDDGPLARFVRDRIAAWECDATVTHQPGDAFRGEGLDGVLEEALSPSVPLAGGGTLWFEPTRACLAIDVDTGVPSARNADRARRDAGQRSAAEIARQIILRNEGGAIAIDPPRLATREDRQALLDRLRHGFRDDRARVDIGAVGGLGLIEISRERTGRALREIMLDARLEATPETAALAALRDALALARDVPGARPVLVVGEVVAGLLAGALAPALQQAEGRLGHPLDRRMEGRGRTVGVIDGRESDVR